MHGEVRGETNGQHDCCATIVVSKAEKIIYEQKFTGAAADLLNPNIIARDLGNVEKALCDALTHAGLWHDDSQIDDLRIIRAPVVAGGRVTVRVEQIGGSV